MSSIEGNVDNLGPEPLSGWAWDPQRPETRLEIVVSVDGETAVSVVADGYREDLAAAEIGDGHHAFEASIRALIDAGTEQQLCVSCGEHTLWSGTTAELVARAKLLNGLRTKSVWAINHQAVDCDGITFHGYVVPAAGQATVDALFTVNGEAVSEAQYPVQSSPSCARLWFVPDAPQLGFRCRHQADTKSLLAAGPVQIECRARSTGQPLRSHDAFFLPPYLEQEMVHLPSAEQLMRVQGNALEDVYLLWGYTTIHKLDLLLQQRLGRSLASFESILDWGCGCGRLTRHLNRLEGPRLTGADIDSANLVWCAAHLPGASWMHLPLQPPAPWPDSTFELITGFSIFTHLREEDQRKWLAELHRITKPGAVLALTFNSDTAMWWADPYPQLLDEWLAEGFTDTARDPALDAVIDDPSYYRATFHGRDYIEREWGKYFEIVHILEATAHIQDLAILRKREE